jgi:chemotaxis protein CheX
MRAEFINPFLVAGAQVLESFIGSSPSPGQLAVRSATFTTQQVSIVIGVTGVVQGQAVYGLSLVTATKLAASMSAMPLATFDEMASSAIAELGNMISGHATTLLSEAGYECQITPPTLIRGANVEISTSTPALVVPLYTDFGKIEINVALKEAAGSGGPAVEAEPQVEAPEVAAPEAAQPSAEGEAAAAAREETAGEQ